MTTPSVDEQLFYKLEPKGKWCSLVVKKSQPPIQSFYKNIYGCSCGNWSAGVFKSFTEDHIKDSNPNLSNPTWETFGWMLERAKKQKWWNDFVDKYLIKTEWDANFKNAYPKLVDFFLDPTAFKNALVSYHEIKKETNDDTHRR